MVPHDKIHLDYPASASLLLPKDEYNDPSRHLIFTTRHTILDMTITLPDSSIYPPHSSLEGVNVSIGELIKQAVYGLVSEITTAHNDFISFVFSPVRLWLGMEKSAMLPVAILVECMTIVSILGYWLNYRQVKKQKTTVRRQNIPEPRVVHVPQETQRQKQDRIAKERKEAQRLAAKKEHDEQSARIDHERALLKKQKEAQEREDELLRQAQIEKEWAKAGNLRKKAK